MRARRRAARGFTLVEVLVAMTLLSLVMLALGAALRTMGQTEQRVDLRLQRSDEARVATQFLSSVLGRVSARKSAVPTAAGTSLYLFSGAPGAVAWIGVMPARHGAGGRYYFRLAPETLAGGQALVLRFVPWTPDSGFPDWSAAQSRVLAADVSSLSLSYADAMGTWADGWAQADKLPARVRLDLQTGAGRWPPLIVPMRTLPAADGGRGGFSLGPE
jgi:general secretion pathway protein J